MNLITLISVILLCAMALEWLLAGYERMQRDVFKVIFCVVAVLFTAKYYYGPDIATYVPLYDLIGDMDKLRSHGDRLNGYERGYLVFCALCNTAGLSFWGMTVVVSLLFFTALYCLLRRLRYGQVMALALIVIMNPDLIYAQLRQCLAVSLFIFSVLSFDRKRYLLAALFAYVATTMHKSALFLIVPTFLYYIAQPRRMEMSSLGTMLLVLCLLVIIPTQEMIEELVDNVVGDGATGKSIKMHIAFSNLRQSNLMVYGAAIVSLMTFSSAKRGRNAILAAAMVALMMIVVFYQYYFMLNRLRAYLLPFAVVAIIEAGIEARGENMPWNAMVRQSCKVIVLGFLIYKTCVFNINSAKDGDVMKMSTVFELANHSKEELRDRQLERARYFWDNAFLKGDDLKYRSKNYVDQYQDDMFVGKKDRDKEKMLKKKKVKQSW